MRLRPRIPWTPTHRIAARTSFRSYYPSLEPWDHHPIASLPRSTPHPQALSFQNQARDQASGRNRVQSATYHCFQRSLHFSPHHRDSQADSSGWRVLQGGGVGVSTGFEVSRARRARGAARDVEGRMTRGGEGGIGGFVVRLSGLRRPPARHISTFSYPWIPFPSPWVPFPSPTCLPRVARCHLFLNAPKWRAFSSRSRDYYDILGVSPHASKDEIKKAYFDLAKRYHPDLNPNDETAKVKFQEVSSAYSVLKDDSKRAQYDSIRARGFRGSDPQQQNYEYTYTYSGPDMGTYDAESMFREVFDEFGMRDLEEYFSKAKREAGIAVEEASKGNYKPGWEFAKNHKGLIASIVLPAMLVLRFPGLVLVAIRGAMVAAVALLRVPFVRKLILRMMYQQFMEQMNQSGPDDSKRQRPRPRSRRRR
mmetsp:Transcript_12458/g.19798  ORF Transcript_12458/g.19798 Transcript_12458/m.19798 type:complete len:422 (-) Transcript_12458:193-1458(-)